VKVLYTAEVPVAAGRDEGTSDGAFTVEGQPLDG
jgi:hypothetical protein